jgi:hypothetical protein
MGSQVARLGRRKADHPKMLIRAANRALLPNGQPDVAVA